MPVAFTSLLDPLTLLLGAPTMVVNTLSAFDRQYFLDFYHYSAPVVPFVVVSSIRGTARLAGRLQPRLSKVSPHLSGSQVMVAVVFAFGLSYHMLLGFTPLRIGFWWPKFTRHHALAYEVMAKVPGTASLSAQNSLVPHLSQRVKVYTFPEVQDADYVLLDVDGNTYPIQQKGDYCRYVASFLKEADYGIVLVKDTYILLKRGQPHQVPATVSDTCTIQQASEADS
jgi:uncharacterized membrane protein